MSARPPLFVVTAALALVLIGSRAAAAERSVVGHSVHGREIVSLHLGGSERGTGAAGGGARILLVGAIHGNETAGMRVARRLIRTGAPGRAEVWVVPTINPDGVAAGTRGNAHGVDLNRNFPYDWAPLGGGEYSGTGPLSEPESRAARRLISRLRPDLTIWFHQPFGIVDRPPGDAFAARRYSGLTGLPLVRLPGRYPGSASRWQNHALPRSTAFVVELPSRVGGSLVRRATSGLRRLAAELASPAVYSSSQPK